MAVDSKRRFYRPELDVIRFVAFCLVLLNHGIPVQPSERFNAVVHSFNLGLPLFFCLSAYLITRLLLMERERTGTIALPLFYKRRMLRIWPLYFGALAVSVVFSTLHHNIQKTGLWYIAAVFMLANTVTGVRTAVFHLWSISIEEQFYLFWPAAVRFLSKRGLAIAASLLVGAANIVLGYYGRVHGPYSQLWFNTFAQIEFFAAGIFLGLVHDGKQQRSFRVSTRILFLTVAGLCWLGWVGFFQLLERDRGLMHGAAATCGSYLLVAICCIALLLAVQGVQRWPRFLVYCGKLSYGLYVFHAFALDIGEKPWVATAGALPCAPPSR